MLFDASLVVLGAVEPDAGQEETGAGTEVGVDDLRPAYPATVLIHPPFELVGRCVAHVVDGAVPAGGPKPNRAVE